MSLTKKIALALVTFVVSVLAFDIIFALTFSLILCVSIALHELGHALAFRWYGYTTKMVFIPFLGAGVIPDDVERVKTIPWRQDAVVALAGPAVNVLLIMVGLIIQFNQPWHNAGMALAQVNAALAAFNLIPFFMLDGRHFANAIFSSMPEEADRKVASFVTQVMLVASGILIGLGHLNFMPFLIVLAIRRESNKDDPADSRSVRAMPLKEAYRLTAVYISLLTVSLVLQYVLPSWTKYY